MRKELRAKLDRRGFEKKRGELKGPSEWEEQRTRWGHLN